MQKPHSSKLLILAFFASGILTAVISLLGNIAASNLPPTFTPYLRYALPIFFLLSLIGIALSAWQTSRSASKMSSVQSQSIPTAISSPSIENISNVSIDDIPCGFCHQKQLGISGQGNGTTILTCRSCGKLMKIVYHNDVLSKIVIPTIKGIAILTTIVEIADYLGIDPSQVGDYLHELFGIVIDSF